MESKVFISVTPEELKSIIKLAIKDYLSESITNQMDDLLTRKEAAKILRISLPTLNYWTKKGIIKAKRINSRVRYSESDVKAALQNYNKYGKAA